MGNIELTGLVDPSTPLDPSARRALAAREIKRLGPTPGSPADPTAPSWTDLIRISFAGLQNDTACEILDCVLDPAYSAVERPAGVDDRIKVYVEKAIPGSDLPDRLHATPSCPEVLPGHISTKAAVASIWRLTRDRVACNRCLAHPALETASNIRGRSRHRIDIRTDVLLSLGHLHQGAVHWPAVHRLANLGTERWEPRFENGFIDRGNPEHWAADPIAEATVELAVAVGHATGQHLAALWDAAMIDVLVRHSSNGGSLKVRRKASKALAAVLEGHSWEELSGIVAEEIDTIRTRKKSIERRVSALLSEFEVEIGELVADQLDELERHDDSFTTWSSKLTTPDAPDSAVLGSRLVMAWHGGSVPEVVLRAIAAYPVGR